MTYTMQDIKDRAEREQTSFRQAKIRFDNEAHNQRLDDMLHKLASEHDVEKHIISTLEELIEMQRRANR